MKKEKCSVLEAQYKLNYEMFNDLLQSKLGEAEKLMYEAIEISEASGITIDSYVTLCSGNAYTPQVLELITNDLSDDFRDLYGLYHEYEGWQHSSICF